MNAQRQVIYEQRRRVLDGVDLSDEIKEEWLPEVLSNVVFEYTASEVKDDWDIDALVVAMEQLYGTGVAAGEIRSLDRDAVVGEFVEDASDAYAEREKEFEGMQEGLMRDLERFMVLQTVDIRWREHLESMDYMREGIHLRGMAQKDPLVEYRNEGHVLFQDLSRAIREEVIGLLFHTQVEVTDQPALEQQQANGGGNGNLSYEHESLAGADAIAAAGSANFFGDPLGNAAGAVGTPVGGSGGAVATKPIVKSDQESIGRNDPCWCGSGKKYKRCHGA
jgi:preprotein translocase subunit SecA